MRIVVVEDEPLIRGGMTNILRKINKNYEVVGVAENGVQGLAVIEKEEPDVIILDIRMPDMDGLEMLEKLRDRGMECRAIILSAFSEFDYAKRAIELGIENYLLKPIKIPELKHALEDIEKDIKKEPRNGTYFDLKNIFWSCITGQFDRDERVTQILEEQFSVSVKEKIYLFQVKVTKEFEEYRVLIKDLLEEINIYQSDFQSCILEVPEKSAIIMVIYKAEDEQEIWSYIESVIVPALCRQVKSSLVFAWKECEGFYSIYQGILEMRKELEWCLIYGRGVLISDKLIKRTQTVPLKYPVHIETQTKQTIVQNNHQSYLSCIAKMQQYCKEEPHTPQDIRGACIRYGMALFHAAKESGRVSENLSANHIMQVITRALTWSEIEETLEQFFSGLIVLEEDNASLLVQRTKQLIREYYNQGITLEEIADKLHVSEEYLSTQFKKETGKTFSETIKGFRIKKVRELLVKSSLKLNQISQLAGYSDPKYMSKVFKEETGVSPAEYRKLQGL